MVVVKAGHCYLNGNHKDRFVAFVDDVGRREMMWAISGTTE